MDTCERRNVPMAGIVNMAISLKESAGQEAADAYLERHHVPKTVIARTFGGEDSRRPLSSVVSETITDA